MPHDEVGVKVEVRLDGTPFEIRAWLSGRFDPIDGRYHWGGRLAPCAGLAELVRQGRRQAALRIVDGGGDAVAARLGGVDPWGGIRVTGLGAPPR